MATAPPQRISPPSTAPTRYASREGEGRELAVARSLKGTVAAAGGAVSIGGRELVARQVSRRWPKTSTIPSWPLLLHRAFRLQPREVRWPELGGEIVCVAVLPRLLRCLYAFVRAEPNPVLAEMDRRCRLRRREAIERHRKQRREARRQGRSTKDET